MTPASTFHRILLIRLSAVGDVINTLPALNAIRRGFPEASIGFLVEDRAKDLIINHPCVDRVHLFPRRRWARMAVRPLQWPALSAEVAAFFRDLKRRNYEVALDFQGNLKGALHGLLSGARLRVGFSRGHTKEGNHLFTHRHVTPPGGEIINRVDKFLSLAAGVGAPVSGAQYQIPDSPDSRSRVGQFLRTAGLRAGHFIAIHPGTSDFGKLKRWMPERFSSLAERIGSAHGLRSLVTWGPGERGLAERVVAGSAGHAVLAMETRSILDLAEILRSARLFVGCDSGPLHLASAVGVPSVALFGPKDPRVYGPYNPHSRVVYKPPQNGQASAMAAITVEDVCVTVGDLLHHPA